MGKNGKSNITGAYTSRSAGQRPNMTGANPKASAGRNTGIDRDGDPKRAATESGGKKAGNHAMLRKTY